MEYRKISALQKKVEEMESPVKKHLNLKIFSNKLPGSWNIMRRWKPCIAGIEEGEEPKENVLNKGTTLGLARVSKLEWLPAAIDS